MTTLLLVIIYIAYIGLGIPDSLFGTAWPAIYRQLQVPVSYASFVTTLVSGGTILSSLVSAYIIKRFGTAKVTAVSTAMTAAALEENKGSGSTGRQRAGGGLPEMLKNPTARASILLLVGSCGIESVCLGWGSTFLVNTKGAAADTAAEIITLYFVGLTLGRFLSGVIAGKLSPMKIILAGETLTAAAILFVMLSPSPLTAGIGLFLVGLGNSPVFPNMSHLAPVLFGKDVSQSYIGLEMSASYASILSAPVIFGLLAQSRGTDLFPYFLAVLFALTFGATLHLRRLGS